MSDDSVRVRGKVKWFNSDKGYGFIDRAEGYNRDIFVHRQQMVRSGIDTLVEDEDVEFVVRDGPKGMFAVQLSKDSK